MDISIETFQRYRNSSEKLVIHPSYDTEIKETAAIIVENNANVHLWMKGGFNENPNQPSSSYNQHNWYFRTKTDGMNADDTHTAQLQYGDPAQQGETRQKTLENLKKNNLANSLQGLVLRNETGFMRLYEVEDLIASGNVETFFSEARDSFTNCQKEDIAEETEILNSYDCRILASTLSGSDITECCDSEQIECDTDGRIIKM
jgi:hypothetical protein